MDNKLALERLSAWEIGELVNSREISPSQVIRYFLSRIQKLNNYVNAFVYVKPDHALKKAAELEERLSKGEWCGEFAGVPFALKDFLPSKKGWTNSHGGVKCLISTDDCDSEFCIAMEKAGGIAIGKTNAPAFGFRGTTDNLMYGPTSTPFNPKYNSGGSSGGSAAAVALGLVPIAEGGDAGGSIRIPASFCNLFGFKAGVGTIPCVSRPDGWSATHPFCVNGALVKSVKDAAILLGHMSRFEPLDPHSIPGSHNYAELLEKPTGNLKIAFTPDFGIFPVENEVLSTVSTAVKRFEQAGFSISEHAFGFKHSALDFATLWCKGISVDSTLELNHMKANGTDLLKDYPEEFPEEFKYWKKATDGLGIEDLYAFNLARTEVLDEFEKVFKEFDLIASPVSCVTGIPNSADGNTTGPASINEKEINPLVSWTQTFLANFAGFPAASLPAGFSKEGVPIGMQLISPRFKDDLLLRASRTYEKIFDWTKFYPDL